MHVDLSGPPLYRRRFAAVELFYNGQARVERLDGGLEAIDEAGSTVAELRPALKSEFSALSDDLTGFWRTQAICAAVELGVFEMLPATSAGLARTCGLEGPVVFGRCGLEPDAGEGRERRRENQAVTIASSSISSSAL